MSATPDLEAMARERCVWFRTGRVRPHEDEIQKNCICRELESFAERVQRETVERACAAVCDLCSTGWNMSPKWPNEYHISDSGGHYKCVAHPIRAAFAEPGKEGE